MFSPRFYAILLVFLVVFILGCVSSKMECERPFVGIEEGVCCLDSNSNNICDNKESVKTTIESQLTRPEATLPAGKPAATTTLPSGGSASQQAADISRQIAELNEIAVDLDAIGSSVSQLEEGEEL
ncbi:MAG: hypothetical protein FJY77_03665 [Candidatus Altiarchaeales archaeon]|nr:hypothetical protein [Candidatus Altiarchaeales archaeon]